MPIGYNKISMGLRQVSVKDAQTSYIIQLLGQKNRRRGDKNGIKLVLKVGCHLASSRHLSKQGL
jgi:hypothetical protein